MGLNEPGAPVIVPAPFGSLADICNFNHMLLKHAWTRKVHTPSNCCDFTVQNYIAHKLEELLYPISVYGKEEVFVAP